MIDVLKIHPDDNVGVAVRPLSKGTVVQCGDVTLRLQIAVPLGAKLALTALKSGSSVIKFGEPIGSLTSDVSPGEYVHTHNLASDYLRTYERGELVSSERTRER
jgi:hypothetical protein